jgi:hypothetical protein
MGYVSNSRSVLIAYDDQVSIELISGYLTKHGFNMVTKENREDAVNSFHFAMKEGKPFGFVYLIGHLKEIGYCGVFY